jgi:hypothetical protein
MVVELVVAADEGLEVGVRLEGKDAVRADPPGALERDEAQAGANFHHHVVGFEILADRLQLALLVITAIDELLHHRGEVVADGHPDPGVPHHARLADAPGGQQERPS